MDNEIRPETPENGNPQEDHSADAHVGGNTANHPGDAYAGANPGNEAGASQPVNNSYNGYYQGYYAQQWPPQTPGGWNAYNQAPAPKPPRKKSGLRALAIVLMVAFLIVGLAAGTFFLAPMISGWKSVAFGDNPSTLPKDNTLVPVPSESAGSGLATQQPGGEVPQIGGQAPDISASDNPIVQIAKEVGPAVVGVTVSVKQPGELDAEETESGYGTGIIISADGYIVTNNHVVAGSDSVKVTLFDGTDYPARLVGTDATTDLAVLKIDAIGLTAAALGDSDALQVGETVVAIGNPLGSDLAGSVTSGIVSALSREITTNGYSQKYIQTDAAINPGNSGGALVNIKGEVIGINTLKSYLAGYDDYGVPIGTEGIGFAIPINATKPIVEQLISNGSVVRPGIGISCLVDEANQYNPAGSPEGVTVVSVTKGGPAEVAGLQPGDIVTAIDGQAVTTVEGLTTIIHAHEVGDNVELSVWRNGQSYRATVAVGDLNNM
jgi:serine protease Do